LGHLVVLKVRAFGNRAFFGKKSVAYNGIGAADGCAAAAFG
jgi:hypothetical protein